MMLLQRVAGAHAVLVVFYLAQEAFALQVLQHLGPAVVLVQPLVTLPGLLGHVACAVHDLNRVQVVFAAQFEVVHVVGRGDLEAAGAELLADVGVADDGQFAAHQGQDDAPADVFHVARVLGMHGHGRVAEHGFGPGGGHGKEPRLVLEGILDVVEMALARGVLHLVRRTGPYGNGCTS